MFGRKKNNFAVLKQFPDHFSSLVLAGAVQAGVADAKAKKVYVYYCFSLSGWNTNNPPSTAARTCILNQLRSVTYSNKGMEFVHLQNKQNKSKNKLVHAHTREKSTFE